MTGTGIEIKTGRRQFLREFLLTAITASLSPLFFPFSKSIFAKTTGCPEIDLAMVQGPAALATKQAIDLMGGMERFVGRGDKVVLKPNISFPNPPHMASTTHPQVVSTIARECLKAGARKILVLDYPVRNPALCLKRSGVEGACRKIEKTHVLGITERKFFQRIKVPEGRVLKEVEVMGEILDSDILINIPVAKSHSTTTVSLGMKNLMGLIWDRGAFHSRMDINQAIADLSTVIKPKLTIIDATRVLASGGPSGPGTVLKLDKILAGVDPVAVDSLGVTLSPWYGKKFIGKEIKHLIAGQGMGLGNIDLDNLVIKKGRV